MRNRNEHKTSLFHRAANAGVAVAVDTRPKRIVSRKGRNDRKTTRAALRKGKWD